MDENQKQFVSVVFLQKAWPSWDNEQSQFFRILILLDGKEYMTESSETNFIHLKSKFLRIFNDLC